MAERGKIGYVDLQRKALSTITCKGPDRIVKVIPAIPHSETMKPNEQYPMGGGGLQWTLKNRCRFFVAMIVDKSGIAVVAATPRFSVFLGESAAYEDRTKVARFLDQAYARRPLADAVQAMRSFRIGNSVPGDSLIAPAGT